MPSRKGQPWWRNFTDSCRATVQRRMGHLRETSKFYTANHGIKVYEMVYSVVATDIIKETQTIAPPHKVMISLKRL